MAALTPRQQAIIDTVNSRPSITSNEIADIVKARLDHVRKDIDALALASLLTATLDPKGVELYSVNETVCGDCVKAALTPELRCDECGWQGYFDETTGRECPQCWNDRCVVLALVTEQK